MRLKHHRQIVDLLYQEWDLGKSASGARGKTCAWLYWLEILSEAEHLIIETRAGNIVGVCGYSKWGSKAHSFRKHSYGTVRKLLANSFLVKNKAAIHKYDQDYDYTPQTLEGYFDGEIAILIVDKKFRGQKIGKKLLQAAFDLARRDHMKNLQILTDESCNYKFYESMGCKKIYEKLIPNSEPDACGEVDSEMGFIYEKDLETSTPPSTFAL